MSSLSGQLPPGGIKEQLGTIYKQIREAQTLDVNGDEMGAYRHYLSSVGLTAQVLSADIQANQGQGTLPENQVNQLYKMARDCLDRGHNIFTTARKEQRPLALFRLATPSPTISPTLPPNHQFPSVPPQPHPSHLTHSLKGKTTQPPQNASKYPPQNQGGARSGQGTGSSQAVPGRNMSWPRGAGSNPAFGQVRGQDSVDGVSGGLGASGGGLGGRGDGRLKPEQHRSQPITGAVHTMSFMAEAKMRNHHMMEQYKSHLRQQYSGKPVYNEAGLSMLRRLEENLSVARIREQNIAKRLKEKQLRAREAGAKAKPVVTLSSLSLEEMCDQVTSFEHGKQRISSLKIRLNDSGSDPSVVYSVISELLSITDHPLSRLLGEHQYSVYSMLRPVGAAVEKAGGLPQLNIQLDNKGLDRKPSIEEKPHPQESHDPPPADDSDALLELLCDDDEDPNDMLSPALKITQSSENRPIGSLSFDSKFERLKKELMAEEEQNGNGKGEESQFGSKNGSEEPELGRSGDSGNISGEIGSKNGNWDPVYENTKESDSHHVYQNVTGSSHEDDELTNAPMFDAVDQPNHSGSENFDLKHNECYMSVSTNNSEATPTLSVPDTGGSAHQKKEVYDNLDDLTKYLKEESGRGPANGREYEDLDNVFVEDTKEKGHYYDIPDGGVLSQQVPAPESQQIEMDEMLPFKNLPPLVCTAHLGDEVAMKKLADTASSVLTQVVKHIHTSLEKLLECFSKSYPILSSEQNRELCCTVLEASFFPAILSPLTIVYRCKNYSEEVAVAKNMCQQVNASPRDLSVRRKYWLLEQSHAPYGEAIDELRRITSYQYPSPKLECLVQMSKRIMKCIEDYQKQYHLGAKRDLVGVDDMLPILSYVILRSGLPQLISECSIMEEFIQEGYIMGEEGFCLTSFLTALKYITQMSS